MTEGKPVGNYAHRDIGDAVYAWLAGLQREIAPVLSRSLAWLEIAIAKKERFGESESFHQMNLYSARTLGTWATLGTNDEVSWETAMKLASLYWQENAHLAGSKWIISHCLDDFMACAVQAGAYVQGIENYERLVGALQLNIENQLKPRDFAYAVCLEQVRRQYDEDHLFNAGRRMLQANLDENWLGAGQSLRSAMWLKIVYWDRDWRAGRAARLTPLETILKAYENMPGVEVPDFVRTS